MLVMISDIKGHDIDRTVIAECFLRNIESEMLLDPTRAQRMQPDGKEKRKREIEKTGSAEKSTRLRNASFRSEPVSIILKDLGDEDVEAAKVC